MGAHEGTGSSWYLQRNLFLMHLYTLTTLSVGRTIDFVTDTVRLCTRTIGRITFSNVLCWCFEEILNTFLKKLCLSYFNGNKTLNIYAIFNLHVNRYILFLKKTEIKSMEYLLNSYFHQKFYNNFSLSSLPTNLSLKEHIVQLWNHCI